MGEQTKNSKRSQDLMDFLAEVFSLSLTFQKTWDPMHLRYTMFSNLARSAHCDGKFLEYSLNDRFKSDYLSTCGGACKELSQQLGGQIQTAYAVNKMDHTQMIVFASNVSVPSTGSGLKSVDIFIAFRGTQGTDFINFRRNLYSAFWPVSLCTECEAHKGFWRNFVALRPDIYPAILRVALASKRSEEVGSLTYATAGMSMGGPLALLGAYHLSLVKYQPSGAVVFGCPRFANEKLAAAILSKFNTADSLKTIGFAYMRDVVPHVPPRFIGYRSAQRELYHIFIDSEAWAQEAMTADYNVVDYLKYDRGYINTASDLIGDKEFAASIFTFTVADHMKYFNFGTVPASCGLNSDDFISNVNATEIF